MSTIFNNPLRESINNAYRCDENTSIENLLTAAALTTTQLSNIEEKTKQLITNIRAEEKKRSGIDSFMHEYDLSSSEGIALMCLAEAMLRIPDSLTIDKLIKEKIGDTDWSERLGQSDSWTINAATWGLMLTGKVLTASKNSQNRIARTLKGFFTRTGEPVIRSAVKQAMQIMSKQFVMGRNIEEATTRAKENEKRGYRYSYDMLGEAARTMADAERYFQDYQAAILKIGSSSTDLDERNGPGISIKLSALHPRYEYAQQDRILKELTPKVLELAQLAKAQHIGFTIDAEEADRLDLSLDVIEKVFSDPSLNHWHGFGIAVQSYQKRAYYVLDWLADLTKRVGRRMNIRLIKGAYWDTEIKQTQMNGFSDYPVFTRKNSTDVSFIACAKKLIGFHEFLYPQFATHNAYSVSVILELMQNNTDYEFQCLHGMGQALYNEIVEKQKIPCRIYAPVGSHEDLLPYLVRRLLENGANTSFVNRLNDSTKAIDDLITSPVETVQTFTDKRHPKIPLPKAIYGVARINAAGIDLSDRIISKNLKDNTLAFREKTLGHGETAVYSPINQNIVGHYNKHSNNDIPALFDRATHAFQNWNQLGFSERANILEKIADNYADNQIKLIAILVNEAGKTYGDAIAEVREAIDFCRYYALRAREDFQLTDLPGYTGETNQVTYGGRGAMLCISPWNFPLAIFTGQIVAALVTGNTVVAKPAEQTSLIAIEAVALMHAAGVPSDVIQLALGAGSEIGDTLVKNPAVTGVLFTGSTQTAHRIQSTLSEKKGAIVPFIAETGGVNAMIADSSALPEQLVMDVIRSAFGSAGQRCSALRVLFIQSDVADKVLEMLRGAVQELVMADPAELNTDLGPVIDKKSEQNIKAHISALEKTSKLIANLPFDQTTQGTFVAPHVFELDFSTPMPPEVFGPVLHVYRYDNYALDQVIQKINNTGYGLTLGVHSRILETINTILEKTQVGNQYVNRDMIGAVVGLQPFGGEGLSGTGPKAGGLNYLRRLIVEKTITVNTTAAGGNASLMSLEE